MMMMMIDDDDDDDDDDEIISRMKPPLLWTHTCNITLCNSLVGLTCFVD